MSHATEHETVLVNRPVEYADEIDPITFRRVLGTFASGVTVVTVEHEGVYHGSTVSSFCSLSLDPPLVLVCIGHHSTTHGFIGQAGAFGINILGEGAEQLSRHFASSQPHKFATVAHHIGQTGVPLLADAITTLECQLVDHVAGGDHSIFIGRVVSAHTHDDTQPLLFFRSQYHRLG